MLFPLLCFLSTPILGVRSAYFIAIASTLAIFLINALIFPEPFVIKHLSTVALLSIGIFFSAYISSVLWKSVMKREERLRIALNELSEKNTQIEEWAQQLAGASGMIKDGSLSLRLPTPPPHASFMKLTENIGEMQKKLARYFGQMVIQDRLNSMGVLASGLAHELNTPLTSIQFLLDTHKDSLPRELYQELEEEVKRMGLITRDFLNFASPHQEGELIDLNAVVTISIPLLEKLHQGKAKLSLDLAPESLFIKAVRTQVEQFLLNLFKNSLDAATPSTLLTFNISTRKINDQSCMIMLQDNGTGISPEVLPKIFDPFFTTKDAGKGVGLGLYIVQEIVKSHGGTLNVETLNGKGTTFTAVFPLATVREERRAA